MNRYSRIQIVLIALMSLMTTLVASAQNDIDYSPAGGNAKIKKSRNAPLQNTPLSGLGVGSQTRRDLEVLQAKKSELEMKIENLTKNINDSKESKARKYRKELLAAQSEFDAVTRIISNYPQSMTDPSFEHVEPATETDAIRIQMEQKAEQKMAEMENADILEDETDPEIRRAYQKFQNTGGYDDDQGDNVRPEVTYFTVQIGSGKSGQAKTFRGLTETVEEHRVKNSHAYTTGRYTSLSQAKSVCQEIKSSTRYRDAYVVAFSNGERVSLDEAARLLR